MAYGLNMTSNDQIIGLPAWAKSARYDINAKEDETAVKALDKVPFEQEQKLISGMLRILIEDLFALKAHLEDQQRTVAALVIAKSGSRLQPYTGCDPSTDPTCKPTGRLGLHSDAHGNIEGRMAPITMLVNWLPSQPDLGGRMVVDQTSLTGRYNFDLHYTPQNATTDTSGPSLFAALQEQLGLKLETKKIPIQVLIIDHIDQPSPN